MRVDDVAEESRRLLSAGSAEAVTNAEATWRSFLSGPLSARERGQALGNLAEVLLMKGSLVDAEEAFCASLDALLEPADRMVTLCGYARLLNTSRRQAAIDRVRAEMEQLLAEFPVACSRVAPWGYAYASSLRLVNGDVAGAVSCGRSAVQAAKRLEPPAGLAEAWTALSDAQEQAGDIKAAVESLEEAIVHMKSGHCLMQARARHGALLLALGDTSGAIRSFALAVEFPDFRDQRVLAAVLRAISSLCRHDPATAAMLTESLAAKLEVRTR